MFVCLENAKEATDTPCKLTAHTMGKSLLPPSLSAFTSSTLRKLTSSLPSPRLGPLSHLVLLPYSFCRYNPYLSPNVQCQCHCVFLKPLLFTQPQIGSSSSQLKPTTSFIHSLKSSKGCYRLLLLILATGARILSAELMCEHLAARGCGGKHIG